MPDSRPSPCSIPPPRKPVPKAGRARRAAAHPAEDSGFGKESPSMAKHKHPAAWLGEPPPPSRTPSPAGLSGAAAKDGKGNLNPRRKHRAATLLSCSRDPRWHSGSEERRLLPRSCQQARPQLRQPVRAHRPPGRSCPRAQRHPPPPFAQLVGKHQRPTSPWHEVIPPAGAQLTSASPKRGEL